MVDLLTLEADKAAARFTRQQQRVISNEGAGATEGALALSKSYLSTLEAFIEDRLKGLSKFPQGPSDKANRAFLDVISGLSSEQIALCVLQSGLHSVVLEDTMRATCETIGHQLAAEAWAAGLTKHAPKVAAGIEKTVRMRHGSVAYRQQAARVLAASHGFRLRDWPKTLKLHAGAWGVKMLLEGLPEVFVEVEEHPQTRLMVTNMALGIAGDACDEAVRRSPVHVPSVEPPLPWTGYATGAYADKRRAYGVTVLRTRHKDTQAAVRAAIHDGTMQHTLDALNALQAVPWTINSKVLSVIKHCADHGIAVPGLPGKFLNERPERGPWEDMTDPERRLWKYKVHELKKLNRATNCDYLSYIEDTEVADLMLEHACFYTPMNLDWRGRVYGIPHFNFQREDRVRALFLFADGEPIGEEGLYWLKVHVANCGDFDKISKRTFDERVAWVDKWLVTMQWWTRFPTDPHCLKYWIGADKPFLFLAACTELVAAIAQGASYLTRLPVSFDGSCSGLQHLCAMTRASEGSLVNLTCSPLPQDVYQVVADRVCTRVAGDLQGDAQAVAKLCLEAGITRTLVKRNVMTYSYSSKAFGMADQQRVDVMKPLQMKVLCGEIEEHPYGADGGYAASKYLAGHIYKAIEEVVHLPAQAMTFLQKLAKALAHEGKPLRWVTPTGLPWINRYHEPITQQISLWLHDRGVPTRMLIATGEQREIAKDKAANGVAPNFVHALDAAHLLRVANASRRADILSVATVHDSFGCLASRAGAFRRIILQEFVTMYEEHDVLTEALQSAQHDLTLPNWQRLPEVPQRGPLEIKDVLDAQFAFA